MNLFEYRYLDLAAPRLHGYATVVYVENTEIDRVLVQCRSGVGRLERFPTFVVGGPHCLRDRLIWRVETSYRWITTFFRERR